MVISAGELEVSSEQNAAYRSTRFFYESDKSDGESLFYVCAFRQRLLLAGSRPLYKNV